jgi:hypothetical protein
MDEEIDQFLIEIGATESVIAVAAQVPAPVPTHEPGATLQRGTSDIDPASIVNTKRRRGPVDRYEPPDHATNQVKARDGDNQPNVSKKTKAMYGSGEA